MIVQAGPYPEPFGGVSVFVKRMKERLDKWGIANEVWDLSGGGGPVKGSGIIPVRLALLPFRCFFRKDVRLIHYHICGVRSKLYIGFFNKLLFRKRKTVLTIHGDARNILKRRPGMVIQALNSFDAVICVRSGDLQFLREKGITADVFEIPAFIPPITQEEGDGLPASIRTFITGHGFVMCANASSLETYQNADLYGIDMCIRLTAQLKTAVPEIRPGFIFCLAALNDAVRFRELQSLIDACGIREDFLVVTEKTDLHPIIRSSDLFIRPTNTDGYSLSLAEALYFGTPSLASDAVPRPEGTVLFKTRDDDDLFHQTVAMVEKLTTCRHNVCSLGFSDNARQLLDVYHKLLSKDPLFSGSAGCGQIAKGT